MTADEIAIIGARADAATRGPWYVEDYTVVSEQTLRDTTSAEEIASIEACLEDDSPFIGDLDEDIAIVSACQDRFEATNSFDLEFIAAARTDVPALVAHIRKQDARIAAVNVPALCDALEAAQKRAAKWERAYLESHDCDEGFTCCLGCTHVGHRDENDKLLADEHARVKPW